MSNKPKIVIFSALLLGIFALVIFFFMGGLGKNPQALPSVMTGKPLPQFSLPTLDGRATLSQDDMPQQAFLLNVWGSWCPSCYDEHPYLMQLQQQINIIGLNWPADNPNESADGLRFLQQLGNPYQHVLTDREGTLITDLGVYGAPETFLISADKRILLRHAGAMTQQVWLETFLPLLQTTEETP